MNRYTDSILQDVESAQELTHAAGQGEALPSSGLRRQVVRAEDDMDGNMARRQQLGQSPEKANLNEHLPGGNAVLR